MTKPTSQDLRMVPLVDEGKDAEIGDGPPQSATQFFAIPQPKRKPKPPPTPEAPRPAGPPPAAGPAGAPPPMMGGMPPAGMVAPMGIQGPVASGPQAMPQGYPGMGAQMPPGHDPDVNRAQSYRVFAIVAGLMFMVFTALIVTALLTVYAVYSFEDPEPEKVAAVPLPKPARAVDTGVPAAPEPVAKPKPKPRTTPRPRPKAEPEPVAAPTDPGPASITVPASEPFTGMEVKCPSGFRERAMFAGGTATIQNVPREDCYAHLKGGQPVKIKIRGGQSLRCTIIGTAADCS